MLQTMTLGGLNDEADLNCNLPDQHGHDVRMQPGEKRCHSEKFCQ